MLHKKCVDVELVQTRDWENETTERGKEMKKK